MLLFTIAFFIVDLMTGTSYIANYLPELMAVFVGVFLALSLEQWELAKHNQTRIDAMKRIVRKELVRMQEAVNARKGNYLESQVWTSLVNSGDAALLPTELQEQLFDIYAEANAHNIETSRLRDAAEAKRRDPTIAIVQAHIELSIRIDKKELDLSNKLHQFLASGVLDEDTESQE